MIPISDDAADLTDCDTIASDHMRTGGENDGVQKTTDDPSPEKPGPAKYDHNLRHAQAALCSRCLECRQKSSRLFSSFSAIAVALASSVAALVYYSGNRTSGSVSFFGRLVAKVARARRAYYARLRKPIKVEVAGPERVVYRDGKEQVVVEKEVVRFIDQIVLIPRWGIRVPFHINSLIRKGDRTSSLAGQDGDAQELASNITLLKKAH